MHGFKIFVVAYIYFDYALSDNGRNNDIRSDGNLCYACVIIAVTFKILFDSNTINALVVLGSLLSITAYFVFVYVMGLFVELDIFDQLQEFARFKQVYFVMFLAGFAAVPFKEFYQSLTQLVFIAADEKELIVDDKSDASSSRLDESQRSASKLLASQSANQILFA